MVKKGNPLKLYRLKDLAGHSLHCYKNEVIIRTIAIIGGSADARTGIIFIPLMEEELTLIFRRGAIPGAIISVSKLKKTLTGRTFQEKVETSGGHDLSGVELYFRHKGV